ncbi:L,D-transpeptidase family protein [Bradyrhizobium genosp. L]|uniref:L,D-transpeptidase n=1 Tax=Bradyrhizobium genosp. L TaxID=83637 RepID=UPI0018A3105C|nr:L,D-transpeptidase [Bradyrhizobium genosp. L]QPF87723.1 L,D-transpeptidase family protein [Bradyrhizobium genosp. L]
MRASGRRISIRHIANERFWQIAILTAAGTLGAAGRADAALYYWNGNDTGYISEQEPAPRVHRQKLKRSQARKESKKEAAAAKEAASTRPQGALTIAISIEQQRVRLYDSNGLYAESPVSTGMKGHSTPMGVFSVIQKQKFHRSNIYSGAPMPFMQRITWSGVAMHAGVLPGYPASHGCIRMPNAFAVKMYNWTRMGARVVITPGTISPESFSHPLLVTQKVTPPQPVAEDILKMDAPLGSKGDKGADKPETNLDLRTSVGHSDQSASLRDNTHTADASGAMPAVSASATMSDASSPAASEAAAKPTVAASHAANADQPDAAATTPANNDAGAPADDKTVGETQAAASSDAAKTETSASEHAEVKAETKAEAKIEPKIETKTEAPNADAAKSVAEAPKVDAAKPDASKSDAAKTADKPAATASAPDAKKDAARLPGLAKTDAPKRAGQIAVYISRKDSKLYVRQNFAPLFEVPVTIAPSDRPLGTHVFTAEADKSDPNLLHWSVVSLPIRHAAQVDDEERPARRRKGAVAVEAKPQPQPDSPSEALDRITIPADAMAQITEALGTGGSIIVSDLGVNQGETGEGTDFIVPLR